MEGTHVSARVAMLFFICLQSFVGCCQTQPSLLSGSDDVTVRVGETVILTCNFSEFVNDEYNVLWKNYTSETPDIGRCQLGHTCYKFPWTVNVSRISLDELERQSFYLKIFNTSISDSGSYECGLEDRSNSLVYHRLHRINLSILPLPSMENSLVYPGSPRTTTKGKHGPTPQSTQSNIFGETTQNKSTKEYSPVSVSPSPRTTKGGNPGTVQQGTKSDIIRKTTQSNPLQGSKDSTKAHRSMVYYCVVASTAALLLALAAFWRTKPRNACRSETTDQNPLQTTKEDQISSPCNTAYEVIDPSCAELQENEIYHILDNRVPERSLNPQSRPTSSQGDILPKYDRSIPKDMKPVEQQERQSAFYHVIAIL